LFDAQPGLRRRIMWYYECVDYSQQELFDIFKLKIDQKHWKLDNSQEVRKLFDQYDDAFPNAGGDVERLLFFCCLEHSKDFISDSNRIDLNTLYLEHVERGIGRLMDNNKSAMDSKQQENDYSNPYNDLMKLFKRNKSQKSQSYQSPTVEEVNSMDDKINGLVKQ